MPALGEQRMRRDDRYACHRANLFLTEPLAPLPSESSPDTDAELRSAHVDRLRAPAGRKIHGRPGPAHKEPPTIPLGHQIRNVDTHVATNDALCETVLVLAPVNSTSKNGASNSANVTLVMRP